MKSLYIMFKLIKTINLIFFLSVLWYFQEHLMGNITRTKKNNDTKIMNIRIKNE